MGYRVIFALCVLVLIFNLFSELAVAVFDRVYAGFVAQLTAEKQQDDW